MPYRLDIPSSHTNGLERLIDLGALDVDHEPDGGLIALMPDHVRPEHVSAALGTNDLVVTPAVGRDDGSVWVLRPRGRLINGVSIAPPEAALAPHVVRLHDAPAFGTGMHPTTGLCVEAIVDIIRVERPATLLDVGTGSGILALAALAAGVTRAHGLDIHGDAIDAAMANRALNGREEQLTLSRGGPDSLRGMWPLVSANILAGPLVEMAPSLVRRVGHAGTLVLSGIPEAVTDDVSRAYRRLGLHPHRVLASEGWTAIVLRASW